MSNENEGPRFPEGKYLARAISGDLGFTNEGNEQVAIEFELLDEAYAGQRITWHGSFSEKKGEAKFTPLEHTIKSLRACGWTGDDLSDLTGIDANEVQLTIEHSEYKGKVSAKVRWVNKLGGLALKTPLSETQKKAFAAKMRGKVLAATRATGSASAPKSNGHPNAPSSADDAPPRDFDDAF